MRDSSADLAGQLARHSNVFSVVCEWKPQREKADQKCVSKLRTNSIVWTFIASVECSDEAWECLSIIWRKFYRKPLVILSFVVKNKEKPRRKFSKENMMCSSRCPPELVSTSDSSSSNLNLKKKQLVIGKTINNPINLIWTNFVSRWNLHSFSWKSHYQ